MKAFHSNLLALLLCLLTACEQTIEPDSGSKSASLPKPITLSGVTMGTTYHVKLAERPPDQTLDQIKLNINAILTHIDHAMSTYRDDSEVSQFNRQSETDWFDVSQDTLDVIKHAQHVSSMTQGRFDMTVGPLVDLWHFGKTRPLIELPSDAEIETAMQRVDYREIEFAENPPRIRKASPSIRIDLSAIAKGYAVDRVTNYLNGLSLSGFMIEIGGEIRTFGQTPAGKHWTIGIASPVVGSHTIQRTVMLSDQAMATSGNYRNFHEVNGKRYSHTIDPVTGRPVEHKTASVTVIADTCMHADAMATALLVMGADEGMALAESHGLAVLFITQEGSGGLVERTSRAFDKLAIDSNSQ